jgi:hypothetical protein
VSVVFLRTLSGVHGKYIDGVEPNRKAASLKPAPVAVRFLSAKLKKLTSSFQIDKGEAISASVVASLNAVSYDENEPDIFDSDVSDIED